MRIEYFLKELNGWLCLNIEDIINLYFKKEDLKIKKIKALYSPINIILKDEFSNPENIISGNYVEVLIKKELSLIINNRKKLNISLSNNKNNKNIYKIWAIAKVISYDYINNILLLEYDDELIAIDDMNYIRPLSEIKRFEEDILIYYIKKISNYEYEKLKEEFETLKKEIGEEKNYLLCQNYDNIKSSLFCFFPKNNINNLNLLKEIVNKYKLINNDDAFTNANTNSEITSRSEESESKSRTSKNSNILMDEEDILNEIHKYEYKEIFLYKILFKKDAEKVLKDIIKKNKYYLNRINKEEFKIIIYGKNKKEFKEEKNNFEKRFVAKELNFYSIINKNEITELAHSSNIKYIYFGKNNIYLIGEEKNISNFEALFNMNVMYNKEIQKNYIEKEKIQIQINNIKKEYKIK